MATKKVKKQKELKEPMIAVAADPFASLAEPPTETTPVDRSRKAASATAKSEELKPRAIRVIKKATTRPDAFAEVTTKIATPEPEVVLELSKTKIAKST